MATIRGNLKNNYSIRKAGSRLKFLAPALLTLCLVSCLTPKRSEINASLWLNNAPIPNHLCELHPELKQYGFYRKLNSGQIEFISFCDAGANQWIAMHQDDFQKLMDKYVPNGTKIK